MTIESLIADYGLPAIFVGAGAEGETVAVLAGVIAHRGTLPYWPVVAAVGLGSFVADQIFFACGRYFKDARFVARMRGTAFFARALAEIEKRPTLFIFGFRFVYGLRTVSPVAIGTTRLPALRFAVVNFAAAAVWSLVFVSAGYLFGHGVETLLGRLPPSRWLVAALAGAAAVGLGLAAWTARRRRTAAAPSRSGPEA
jgi:membrane protein DedA with SNARE-associated domain